MRDQLVRGTAEYLVSKRDALAQRGSASWSPAAKYGDDLPGRASVMGAQPGKDDGIRLASHRAFKARGARH